MGVLTLAAVLAALVAAALASGDRSPDRRDAITFAATVCGAAALAGWLVAGLPFRAPAMGVAAALGAVSLRIFPPLAALAWLQAASPRMCAAGGRETVLGFYLALLATDLVLTIIGGPRNTENSASN